MKYIIFKYHLLFKKFYFFPCNNNMIKVLNRLPKNTLAFFKINRRWFHSSEKSKQSHSESSPKSLNDFIRQEIKATGPMSLARFMSQVLTHPTFGYYTTRDVFGKEGDFITSPEISPLFGELVGIWLINEWSKVSRPTSFNLVELGPGRGTMMRDIIKVFKNFRLHTYMVLHLIEVSEVLCNIQAEKLGVTFSSVEGKVNCYKYGKTKDGIEVFWYKTLIDYKYRKFSLIVAHEFFDAVPINKFKKTDKGYCEVFVDIDPNDSTRKKFRYVLSDGPTAISKVFVAPNETRDEVEISTESMLYMGHLATKMIQFGGIALVIDYGHYGTKTDTFRAFRKHEQCDPLSDVGSADLTADVDFLSLQRAVTPKLITRGPVTQRQFLKQMQIDVRLQALLENCKDEKQKENLKQSYDTLTDEDKMGSRFYFMSFFPKVLTEMLERYPPVGFIEDQKK